MQHSQELPVGHLLVFPNRTKTANAIGHAEKYKKQAIRGKPIVIFLYMSSSSRKLCQESLLTVLFHSTLRKCRKRTCAQTRILVGFADIEMVSDSLPQPREAESKEKPRTFRYSHLHTCSVLCFIDSRCGLKTVRSYFRCHLVCSSGMRPTQARAPFLTEIKT